MNFFSKKNKPVPKEDADLSSKDKIKKLLSFGKLDKALDMLIQEGQGKAILLKTKLIEAQTQSAMGKLKNEDLLAMRNRITYAILGILEPSNDADDMLPLTTEPEIEPIKVYKHPQKAFSETEKAHIQELIHQNKTEKALLFCVDFGHSFLALTASFKSLQRNSKLGLVTKAEEKESIDAINASILDLVIK